MDNPIVVQIHLNKRDLLSHAFYLWRRQALWRGMGGLIVTVAIMIISIILFPHFLHFPHNLSAYILIAIGGSVGSIIGGLIGNYLSLLIEWHKNKTKIMREVTTSFLKDGLKVECAGSNAFIKYDELKDIFIYKSHIIIQHVHNIYRVIPWRDVPVDRHADLTAFLQEIKRKIKS